MNSKLNVIALGGGALLILSAFLPWISIMGRSLSGFQGSAGNPGAAFVLAGVLIGVFAYLNKKWSNIAAIVVALAIGALSVKYLMDGMAFNATGFGIYVMILGALAALIGSILAMRKS